MEHLQSGPEPAKRKYLRWAAVLGSALLVWTPGYGATPTKAVVATKTGLATKKAAPKAASSTAKFTAAPTSKAKAPQPAANAQTAKHKGVQKQAAFTAPLPASRTGTAARRTSYARPAARTRPVATWRRAQMVPANDRYRQIQEALAEKGYLRNTPDGTWNADSVEALKRFQADQKLETDGKLSSLSLMALGLGPKPASAEAASAKSEAVPVTPAPGVPVTQPVP